VELEKREFFIGGEFVAPRSEATIDIVSPSTEEVIGSAPDGNGEDVDRAVAAARQAFDHGPWRTTPVTERADLLDRALARLEPKLGDIATTVSSEMGLPISIAGQLAPLALDTGRYFTGLARCPRPLDRRPGQVDAVVLHEPVGVVAAIAPWNGPFNTMITKVVPALVQGCSVVYKPAAETPADAFFLAEALAEEGLPAGVLNVVTGGRETGAALVSHPGVDKVSFTGSTAAGRWIGETCGRTFKRVQLELGGKSAAIVLDDADLTKVAAGIASGTFFLSGQICLAYSRVLVPRERQSDLVDLFVQTARSFVVGDPALPTTTLGPLVAERQRDRVEGYIAKGHAGGAKLATGGGRPADLPRGWYVEPTVFADVDNASVIAQEEIFGPVLSVIPYDTVDHAIQLANDSEYGLHGGVFTEDPERAVACARAVRSGTFSINTWAYNHEAPFGGVKSSGVGRDTGAEALEAYVELKTVNLDGTMDYAF
jgi:aldehyde dehydrogenase (NAD+)